MVDRNVAIVNGETITLSEITELAKPYFDEVRAKMPPEKLAEGMARARRIVLEKLIDKRLIAQEAKKRHIKVSDSEIDKTLKQLLASKRLDEKGFYSELKAMGLSERQYREELREQILSSKLIQQAVRATVVISEEKILARYREQNHIGANDAYHLLQIGLVWGTPRKDGSTLSKEQARAQIHAIRKEALDGTDFAVLARKYSDLPSAEEGGSLGALALAEMAPAIRSAVEHVKAGELSEIVELEPYFLFFKRLESQEKEETGPDLPSVSERERIRSELLEEETNGRVQEWIKELREKSYIKIL